MSTAKTRVVHSSPVWLPLTQTWMHTQATCLPSWVENHIACETTRNLEQFDLPNIHALARGSRLYHLWDKLMRGFRLRRYMGHLPKVLRKVGAHLLHSHFGHVGWTNLRAARKEGTPHVVTCYGQDISLLPRHQPAWRERYRDLFQGVDQVLCEGPHMAACVVELSCPEDRVQVHHLGVNLEELQFEARGWDGRSPFRVLMAGSFTEKKGFPDAIRALARIRDGVDLAVTIVGDAGPDERDQDEKRRILAAIRDCGLDECVTLLGYQPHARLLAEAYRHHVFLSPSVHAADGDTEGGAPVTIIEMAATGMPIVSTLHCDIPEVVLANVSGLLAEEHDIDGLATHLERLVQDPGSWIEMATAGRQHIEEHYDMHRQGEALARIYRTVLEARDG